MACYHIVLDPTVIVYTSHLMEHGARMEYGCTVTMHSFKNCINKPNLVIIYMIYVHWHVVEEEMYYHYILLEALRIC